VSFGGFSFIIVMSHWPQHAHHHIPYPIPTSERLETAMDPGQRKRMDDRPVSLVTYRRGLQPDLSLCDLCCLPDTCS
jgi:hypothetical protein